jgi:hypothetical protein
MQPDSLRAGALLALLALLAGCSSAPPAKRPQLAPNSAATIAYPPLPAPDQPAPLDAQHTFGLYDEKPSAATVEALSRGTSSPDGRFRAAFTDQGAWIVRADGAWYWQIMLPAQVAPPPQTAPGRTGQTGQPGQTGQVGQPGQAKPGATGEPSAPGKPTAPGQPGAQAQPGAKPAALGAWTPAGRLLVQAVSGLWFEADPLTATVTPLAPFWQGRTGLQVSPDDKQVLYTQPGPKGPQVWVANRDGSKPTLVADNATAVWGPDNRPVITKLPEPTPPPKTGGAPQPGSQGNPGGQGQPGAGQTGAQGQTGTTKP